ncbi:MAG: (d)CMP kinase, partial [Planctomycetaceae bacterium]|nr:(d)CMP kinase [Planctomycetaceae bacterium]
MLISIDGPAGSGKSTAAKLLAKRLSAESPSLFEYLDTGSMYRSIALLGFYRDVDWQSPDAPQKLTELAASAQIDIKAGKTYLDGKDVTTLVRMPQVTQKTYLAADNPEIRHLMVKRQREIAEQIQKAGRGIVTEGRDQGTAVFPDAFCKFYLNASPEERAKRRCREQ